MLSSVCALALGLALNASAPQDRTAPLPPDRPFHDLLPNLGRDIRALPSEEAALIAGIGVAAAFVVHPADDNLLDWSEGLEDSGYSALGSWIGDGWTQGGAAVATYAIGVATKNATATHVGSDLVRAQVLNGLATRGLKIFVDRKRPSGGGHSLPSGHSSATFATASVLGSHFGWKVGAPAYAVGAFVSWARVRDGHHWLTDVVVGAAIGTIAGRAVARTHGTRWTVVPAVSASSTAVFIVRK